MVADSNALIVFLATALCDLGNAFHHDISNGFALVHLPITLSQECLLWLSYGMCLAGNGGGDVCPHLECVFEVDWSSSLVMCTTLMVHVVDKASYDEDEIFDLVYLKAPTWCRDYVARVSWIMLDDRP